jgi:hypothetical protein
MTDRSKQAYLNIISRLPEVFSISSETLSDPEKLVENLVLHLITLNSIVEIEKAVSGTELKKDITKHIQNGFDSFDAKIEVIESMLQDEDSGSFNSLKKELKTLKESCTYLV